MAAKDKHAATAMIWNYHDDDVSGEPAVVLVNCKGIPSKEVTVKYYRIDQEHSNSYEVWKKMGAPQQPTREQIAELEKAGQLKQTATTHETIKKGLLQMNMQLPRQGIVFLKIEWK
jgi:xylan 1,4-beta-xylosidase